MNVSFIVNTTAKIGTGLGVGRVVASGCRMVLPEAVSVTQKVTNAAAVWGITGVATNFVWQYVDQTQASIEGVIKKIKEKKPEKKAKEVKPE